MGRLNCRRRGAVLVLVLIVFSALSLIALGMAHRYRLELKMTQMRGNEMRAYYLALGGINRAIVALRQPADPQDGEVVHYGQAWHVSTSAATEGFFEEMGDSWRASCELSYSVTDEEGRLNLNNSSPAGWTNLPGVTRPMVDSILDWIDDDDSPRPEGAESADYLRQPYPYRAKNAPMGMVWELGYVANVGWRRTVGDGKPAAGEGGTAVSDPPDDIQTHSGRGLADFFTVYGDGKVNLNTADTEVLAALPGISRQAAEDIVGYRAGQDRQAFTPDDRFFHTFEDLKLVEGLSDQTRELLQQYCCLKSQDFRIVSSARVREGGPVTQLVAIARRSQGDTKVVLVTRR